MIAAISIPAIGNAQTPGGAAPSLTKIQLEGASDDESSISVVSPRNDAYGASAPAHRSMASSQGSQPIHLQSREELQRTISSLQKDLSAAKNQNRQQNTLIPSASSGAVQIDAPSRFGQHSAQEPETETTHPLSRISTVSYADSPTDQANAGAANTEQIPFPAERNPQGGEQRMPSSAPSLPMNATVQEIGSSGETILMERNEVKILSFGDRKIPQIQVSDQTIVTASPLSPTQVQIRARASGSTKILFWTETEKVIEVVVRVRGIEEALQEILNKEFQNAVLKVDELGSGVLISGYIDEVRDISAVENIANEYYPKVVTNIRIGGVHKVLLHVKILEVSRSKLRQLGFDWYQLFSPNGIVVSSGARMMGSAVEGVLDEQGKLIIPSVSGGATSSTFTFQLIDGGNAFLGFLNALEENKLAKLIAEPTLVAASGSQAHFHSGGRVPVVISTITNADVMYENYGIETTFYPIVYGNGNIRLNVETVYSEIDKARSEQGEPAFKTRKVSTTVELKAGHTLALAGLLNTTVEASRKGIPVLSDLPYIGNVFGRVEHRNNEQELLIMVTPELVTGIDPSMLPECELGMNTRDPSDFELFMKRQIEVNCGDQQYGQAMSGNAGGMPSSPPGMTVFQEGEVIEPGKLIEVNDIPVDAPPRREMVPPVPSVPPKQAPDNASERRSPAIGSRTKRLSPAIQMPSSGMTSPATNSSGGAGTSSKSYQRAPLQPPASMLERTTPEKSQSLKNAPHPFSLRTVVPPSLQNSSSRAEAPTSKRDQKEEEEKASSKRQTSTDSENPFKKPLIRSSNGAGFSTTSGIGKETTASRQRPPLPGTRKPVAAERSKDHPVPLPPVRPAAFRQSSVEQSRPMSLPPVQ